MFCLLRKEVMAFIQIPGFKRYLIAQNGIILDNVAETVILNLEDITPSSRISLICENRSSRRRKVLVARLILMTHKPIPNVDLTTVWSPKLIDEDNPQLVVSNLDYDFGEYVPVIPADEGEFHPVPGYIETEINLKGQVRMSGKLCKLGNQNGYVTASARLPDGESITVGRHRLMSLTFLKHPMFCGDLIVNHKNGKPGEDQIDNLEWTTYHFNMTHAHVKGLRSDNIPLEVRNDFTGEVVEFFSLGEFSRKHNLNQKQSKRLEFRMRTFKVISKYKGYTIRRKDLATPWEMIPDIDKYKGAAKEVIVTNTVTNEAYEFYWLHEAATFLGLTQYVLRNRLQKFGNLRVGDYAVSYATPLILAGK